MNIKEIELDKLQHLERNAMLHPPDNIAEIKRSLQKFGQRRLLVVRKATMEVEAGNGTLQAMRELGWTKAKVLLVDDDEITARSFALADNRTAQLAEFDPEFLLADMRLLAEEDHELIGWSDAEIAKILETGAIVDALEENLGGETPRTLGNPDKPKRNDAQCNFSVPVHAKDMADIEHALDKARQGGAMTRGDQLLAICRAFVGGF